MSENREKSFDFTAVHARVTDRKLRDPDYWRLHGIPMPAQYRDFEIPASVRKPDHSAERAAAREFGDEP